MTILNEQTLDFVSSSMEQTVRLGVRLGELFKRWGIVFACQVNWGQEKQP